MERPRLFGAAALIALAIGGSARADTLDPSMPRIVAAGAPRGAAPSERLDPRRTGRARTSLPTRPIELWRRHVNGNVDVPPVIDEAGNIFVALSVSELVKLGPEARELWRGRLNGAAVAAPALLSDGTVAVVTTAGTAYGFTPAGALRFATPLGVARRDADTVPLALTTGGLLVAAGSSVVELDADGVVRARGILDDRGLGAATSERATGAVVEGPEGALVTTIAGGVYRFRPPAAPRKIGSFGGTPSRGAVLADERTLVAVVDGRRLVALDLLTGTAQTRAAGTLFDAPPALGPRGLVLVGTQLGALHGFDAVGNERVHVLLDKAPVASPLGPVPLPGGVAVPTDLKPSPPLVVDPHGRVGFVRAGGRAGVLTPGENGAPGKLAIAADRVCSVPVALVPAGDKRMLVACRDGGLWMYGE